MRVILINAPALRSSGGLTVLKDFMSFLYSCNYSNVIIHLITSVNFLFNSTDVIKVHEIDKQNWKTRLLWDMHGLQNWCILNNLKPDYVISLQNTCSHFTGDYKNIKQLVYYHQLIPLVKYNWNIFRKDERKLFLYAHFYCFFVNRWNKNAEYVVQLAFVKELFCKKFSNIPERKVHVIHPNLPDINVDFVMKKNIYSEMKVFIYPATQFRYKNHLVILRALDYLRTRNPEVLNKIKIIFTVPIDSYISKVILNMKLDSVVECVDNLPHEELLSFYKRSDALLFPSKIESFGLPLIEAAMFGIPIIASNLPYAREVLEEYHNSVFINSDDFISWANAIKKICVNEKQLKPMIKGNINTWKSFEQLMFYL